MRFCPLLLVLVLALVLRAEVPPELPVDTFFGNPEISQLKMSPTGRYLASLRPFNKRMQLVVVDMETKTSKRLTDMKDENIMSFSWLKDNRLIFQMQNKGQESVGHYAINADGSNLTIIRQAYRMDSNGETEVQGGRIRIVNTLPDDPNEIVVELVRGSSGLGDLYRMNVHKENKMRIICPNPGKVTGWRTDNKGTPRIGIWNNEKERITKYLYRSNEKSDWVEIASFGAEERYWYPLGFDADDKTLFIVSNVGRDKFALFTYDPEQRQVLKEIYSDPIYDVQASLYRDDKTHKVQGFSYTADREKVVWLDPEMQKLQTNIDKVLPGTLNFISSSSRDLSKLIISAISDKEAGVYYYLDAKTMEMFELMRRNAKIKVAQMSEMRPVSYKARDGMTIYAYLTLPAGREPKGLPLIVLPHGGPYGPRDEWGYDPEAQFLANRGIAVLQANYRGSGGYGVLYEEAGYKRWGLEMQDDLTDGALWLIQEGIVDRARVGIYGGSYGGYAAMMAVIKEPELFRCAVNYVGVTDLTLLFPHFESREKPSQEYIAKRWGHPLKDKAYQRDNSPINNVDKIKAPVLMAYGFFDPRVQLAHGRMLRKEMKKKGKEFEYIESENEGHGFGREENRVAFYQAMDVFLKKHLIGKPEAKVTVGPAKVTEMPAK